MTQTELRQKIERQLTQLPPEQLSLASDFLDSLQSQSVIVSQSSLLSHAPTGN